MPLKQQQAGHNLTMSRRRNCVTRCSVTHRLERSVKRKERSKRRRNCERHGRPNHRLTFSRRRLPFGLERRPNLFVKLRQYHRGRLAFGNSRRQFRR
jgi:hypothetical protein